MDFASNGKAARAHSSTTDNSSALCDHTLRKVLSWLEVPDIVLGAALVSRGWHDASQCKEVLRRRMHKKVLNFFKSGHIPAYPKLSPARLFHMLYQPNLLLNNTFLERQNLLKPGQGPCRHAWEATHNARGMTWAHPFDFYPELSPLLSAATTTKPFSVGCLATGPTHNGEWSEMVQVVDLRMALQRQGVPAGLVPEILSAGLPVKFSVYVAGGPLAGGEYQVVLTLLSDEDVMSAAQAQLPLAAIPKMSVPFGHPPTGSLGIAATAAANLEAMGFVSAFTVTRAPLQPTPGDWSRHCYRVNLLESKPVSHIIIALRGRATRNRRGHYATKFASAELGLVTADRAA